MSILILKDFRETYNVSREELAKILDVTIDTLNTWEYRNKKIPKTKLKYVNSVIENYVKNTHKDKFKPEGKIINEGDYPVKDAYIVPIKGRGGLENVFYADEAFNSLETEQLQVKQMPSNGSKYFKIEVEGISMDDGSKKSLAEGDWAYCRSIGKQYWKSKLHSHKWDIFCFFHNERGIIFKKIKDQNTETGELLLESLHPDKEQFPNFTIKVSECSYICNVIKVLSEF